MAAAIDPRYGHLDFISPALREAVWEQLLKWVIEFTELSRQINNSPPQAFHGPPPPEMTCHQLNPVVDTLRSYFESKPHKEDDHVDPLAEWKGYSSWYSPLTSFVCLILSIPCTSAPSERTFSHSGYLASKARNRIGSDVLELFTVVKSYLQNYSGEEEVLLAEIMATLQQWTENG